MRCDGSADELGYEEDVRMILREMQPSESGSGMTEYVGGSQWNLAPVAAPPRPALKSEKKKATWAMERRTTPGY